MTTLRLHFGVPRCRKAGSDTVTFIFPDSWNVECIRREYRLLRLQHVDPAGARAALLNTLIVARRMK